MRRDELDPLPYDAAWPDLRSAWGRVDVHTLAAFFVAEQKFLGHYLEFGVGAGRSAVAAIRAHQRYSPAGTEKFFLFDSFAGLPALSGPDVGSVAFHEGQYAFGESQVRDKLKQHGVWNDQRVHLVPGFFEQSLATFDTSRFGGNLANVVHVDVDLYGSAKTVLEWVTPFLRQGTVMLFDDWNAFDANWEKGERRAVREWLAERPFLQLESFAKYGWHGEAFLVHG
ncbi:MAG: TylF/MycF/NovP-related O-methyltransferase [Candidatus Eisenbacteria bacterium]